jgi:hypothetical protein
VDNYYEGVPTAGPPRTGWLVFSATVLVVSGIFKIFDALWAFKYDDELSQDVQTFIFEHDLRSWGWVWLIVGIVLIVVGLAVVTGSEIARGLGIFAAAFAAVTFLPWIYYKPSWTILSVSLAILVIYGLAAHGGRRSGIGSAGPGTPAPA